MQGRDSGCITYVWTNGHSWRVSMGTEGKRESGSSGVLFVGLLPSPRNEATSGSSPCGCNAVVSQKLDAALGGARRQKNGERRVASRIIAFIVPELTNCHPYCFSTSCRFGLNELPMRDVEQIHEQFGFANVIVSETVVVGHP